MSETPGRIIAAARQKAKNALLYKCADEIQRICDAFFHETGRASDDVQFRMYAQRSMDGNVDHVVVDVEILHDPVSHDNP